ncbi:MAG: hypothetical protein RI932_1262, partial [Pseudomonadota bacterium]
WSVGDTHFKRTISAASKSLPANRLGAFEFQVQFDTSVPLQTFNPEFHASLRAKSIYASHTLFAAEPGDVVEWGVVLENNVLNEVLHSDFSIQILASRKFAPDSQPVASKFYVQTSQKGLFCTSLVRKRLGVRIDVLQESNLPWVGIWWCHNGWGDGRPHSTVGIEPTNLPSDGPVLHFSDLPDPPSCTASFAWIISKI